MLHKCFIECVYVYVSIFIYIRISMYILHTYIHIVYDIYHTYDNCSIKYLM